MTKRISVSNLAFYAEDPKRFVQSNGQPYNAAAARVGQKRHQSIGRRPSRTMFIVATLITILAYLYLSTR